jgi:amino-acid N-acetyltransferase
MNGMDGLQVSGAAQSDMEDILALLTAVNLPHEGVREHLASFVVARDGVGRLVGCAGLERHVDVGLLRSVAVSPQIQRSGIGSRLTVAALELAVAGGVKEVVLLTSTARDFFARRFGFSMVERGEFDRQLSGSPEWGLPRCSTSACMALELKGVAS